jgi:hypothetical protein
MQITHNIMQQDFQQLNKAENYAGSDQYSARLTRS